MVEAKYAIIRHEVTYIFDYTDTRNNVVCMRS